MARLEEIVEAIRTNELLKKKEEKKNNWLIWALAIIGAVAVIAGIAYAVYRYLTPDYLEDFDEDFDDDFEEDDLEEDLEEELKAPTGEQQATTAADESAYEA